MAGQYKQFLNLIKTWPVDKNKAGRDLAFYIQQEVKKAFNRGPFSSADEHKCAKVLASLKRLNDNYYGQKYSRTIQSSSSGLSREECNAVLSSEFLELLNKPNKGVLSSIIVRG